VRHPALVAAIVLTGCFYYDPINQRPTVDIRNNTAGTPHRGDMVTLEAVGTDPDGEAVSYTWHIAACTDASDQNTDCDPPFRNDAMPSDEQTITFQVPPMRVDGVTPVKAIRVILDATDELGAQAHPSQELMIAVDDYLPHLDLRQYSSHNSVVDSHIQLYVELSDQDDGPDGLTLAWSVVTPDPSATFDPLTDLPPVDSAPGTKTVGMSFLPHTIGHWMVHVVATDPLGGQSASDFIVDVTTDLPPCITSPSPIASPTDELPLFEPTLFEVPIVLDDLDVYPPPQPGDPDLGTATFTWSIKQPGAASFAPLAITSNAVGLDPQTYQSGDVVELRVEIHDRIARATCAASDPTCVLDQSRPTCLQRDTWKVRVP
jgi:hypothetical protein